MKQFAVAMTLTVLAAGSTSAAPRRAGHSRPRPTGGVIRRVVTHPSDRGKAVAPVSITLVPGPIVGPGKQRIRIVVTPRVNAERVELNVSADEGLGWAGPPPALTAPARAGQAVPFDLTAAVIGPGERRLVVTATLVFADGRRLPRVAGYTFNPQSLSMQAVPAGARRVKERGGRTILEVPADDR